METGDRQYVPLDKGEASLLTTPVPGDPTQIHNHTAPWYFSEEVVPYCNALISEDTECNAVDLMNEALDTRTYRLKPQNKKRALVY
jgi:hypothetical protein